MLARTRLVMGVGVFSMLLPGIAHGQERAEAPSPPAVAPPTVAAPGGPMTLDQAVQLAVSRNERAKISDLNVVVADAAVEKARAGFLPVLTAQGQDTQHTTAATSNIGTANVTVNQPVINASAYPLYSQAKRLADAQQEQNVDDKRLLAFSAASGVLRRAQRAGRGDRGARGRTTTRRRTSPTRRPAPSRGSRAPTT